MFQLMMVMMKNIASLGILGMKREQLETGVKSGYVPTSFSFF